MNIGVYVHLPFCKSRCIYCDFYSQTDLSLEDSCLEAINSEMSSLNQYYGRLWTESLYLGGGTPSLIKTENLFWLIYNIFEAFPNARLRRRPEITIELNPDDVTSQKLQAYINMGINRISLGVQTFNQKLLRFLKRRHSMQDNHKALIKIRQHRFDNISVDLIFALPDQNEEDLKKDLDSVMEYDPEHISIYCLTYEPGTHLYSLLKNGKLNSQSEDQQAKLYSFICEYLKDKGYTHYEISNFCKADKTCYHNLNYWRCGNYIGLGPGAHSHIEDMRWGNVRDVNKYIGLIGDFQIPIEFEEKIDTRMKAEELLLMSLRTSEGLDINYYQNLSGHDLLDEKNDLITKLSANNLIEIIDTRLRLTERGFLLADKIILELS